MNTLEKQQKLLKEEKEKLRKEILAKCLFDLTKISFTGLVIGFVFANRNHQTALFGICRYRRIHSLFHFRMDW